MGEPEFILRDVAFGGPQDEVVVLGSLPCITRTGLILRDRRTAAIVSKDVCEERILAPPALRYFTIFFREPFWLRSHVRNRTIGAPARRRVETMISRP